MSNIEAKPGGESVFPIIQINNTQFITLGGVIWTDVSTPYDTIQMGHVGFNVFTYNPTSIPTSIPTKIPTSNPTIDPSTFPTSLVILQNTN